MPSDTPTLPLCRLPQPAAPGAVYLRPVGLLAGSAADSAIDADLAHRLGGGPLAFSLIEVAVRPPDGDAVARAVAPADALRVWAADQGRLISERVERLWNALTTPRAPFAGLDPAGAAIMGIVNVTPDSFSDGGDYFDRARAVGHGLSLREAGADLLDVGGESTRPGADPVAPDAEARRVVPVIAELARAGAVVSVDTRHAAVMRAAIEAGAKVVNDITGLTGDRESVGVVAECGAPVILMHMQGEPRTMQAAPTYRDAALDVFDWLEARIEACHEAGIPPERIAVDPGIGFGKTVRHNLEILERLALFHALGRPVLVGASRKRFIASLSRDEPPKDRVPGSLAAGLAALGQGAQIIRVHDVAETRQARAVWGASTLGHPER